jgi:hypothetical protein
MEHCFPGAGFFFLACCGKFCHLRLLVRLSQQNESPRYAPGSRRFHVPAQSTIHAGHSGETEKYRRVPHKLAPACRVSTSGVISTFAGKGTYGYSGDGGPATSAQFSDPSSVAMMRRAASRSCSALRTHCRNTSTTSAGALIENLALARGRPVNRNHNVNGAREIHERGI